METTTTSAPVCSFRTRAASTAFRSSGLVIAAMEARFRVPSGFTATLPEVIGDLLDTNNDFHFHLPPILFHTHGTGDDHALDLGSALVDLGDLGVAHHALHRVLTGIAVAAEQLHGAAG